jgi:hypothetical protein
VPARLLDDEGAKCADGARQRRLWQTQKSASRQCCSARNNILLSVESGNFELCLGGAAARRRLTMTGPGARFCRLPRFLAIFSAAAAFCFGFELPLTPAPVPDCSTLQLASVCAMHHPKSFPECLCCNTAARFTTCCSPLSHTSSAHTLRTVPAQTTSTQQV